MMRLKQKDNFQFSFNLKDTKKSGLRSFFQKKTLSQILGCMKFYGDAFFVYLRKISQNRGQFASIRYFLCKMLLRF